ncbi:hypothetical protein L6452_17775 [Arctium lappa]|uniref:Uncharacterized protein n=1 Tax=Arctium lappa TaxID=4217 RepID=A0ACB9C4B1_ARCLA|nr:hypothetical protein L6452_17775 [Arctium lappa]
MNEKRQGKDVVPFPYLNSERETSRSDPTPILTPTKTHLLEELLSVLGATGITDGLGGGAVVAGVMILVEEVQDPITMFSGTSTRSSSANFFKDSMVEEIMGMREEDMVHMGLKSTFDFDLG